MEPVAMMAAIAAALNVVDKFVTISDRLLKKEPKPFSVEAKQVGDKVQIVKDGHVDEEVKASQLTFSSTDQIRFETLKKKVEINWRLYNSLDVQLTLASGLEQAKTEANMLELKEKLCPDFKEMVLMSEKILGIHLADHYTLYHSCN